MAVHLDENLLTVEEVAGMFSVTPRTVYRWIDEGLIHGIRMGRLLRIRSAEVEDFLRRNTT